ncbi:MAG: Gfo/Idh/MocA family oxidoreductase [Kiritimatiellae bacterium]|nr:Gfo/Idh/MocA family oxidoreductase [Kiritimatiellia bacterium]
MSSKHAKRQVALRKERFLRFGVIGAGGMGQGYCRILGTLPHARLAAVCDVNRSAAEEVGRKFGVPSFCDHREMIKAKVCDAAAIVTPHPFHYQPAMDCMNAGLHVISEKPLTERVSTADRMAAAAKKNGVVFAVMFQRRLEPAICKALDLIHSGQLGEIFRATLMVLEYRNQCYYNSGVWRATWKGEGGGVMMNQAPHMMDLFVQFCGLPSAVFGRTCTRMHAIEVEDQAEAMLKFPNGGVGYLYCSTCETGPGQMIELFGEKGKLVLRDGEMSFYQFRPGIRSHIKNCDDMWAKPDVFQVPLNIPQVRPSDTDYEAPFQVVQESQPGHAKVLANMVRHILFGESLATPGASGIGSLELANAITLSSHEGRWINLPISRSKYDALLNQLQRESKFVKKAVQVKRMTDPRLGA